MKNILICTIASFIMMGIAKLAETQHFTWEDAMLSFLMLGQFLDRVSDERQTKN
jgi:hypothetical protein